jgi:hydrogenase expression/formation protein HypD
MRLLVEMKELELNGFIAPGHVSTIIGAKSYDVFPRLHNIPTVIAGFEPLDILFALYMILKQLQKRKPQLENEYVRAVSSKGNTKAQNLMKTIFKVSDGDWRGLGTIPSSALGLQEKYEDLDAHLKYDLGVKGSVDIQPGCLCHLVIVGKIKPTECPLFTKTCSPQNPTGPCMVSSEGTCRIWAEATNR